MPDQIRSLATLQALLADNGVGAISPQDLRDLMESLRSGRGGLYVSSPAATSPGTPGVPLKALGTTASFVTAERWSLVGSNRLRYDGATQRLAVVHLSATLIPASASKRLSLVIGRNGSADLTTRVIGLVADATVGAPFSTHWIGAVSNGDYFEAWLANDTDTAQVTLNKAILTGQDFLI